MILLDIDAIIVPEDRQRASFNEARLADLESSLVKFLIHPITIRSLEEPVLIAGESRLRIIRKMAAAGQVLTHMGQQIPLGKIPVLPFNQADTTLIFEAELVENMHRADLTWQEQALATAKLHALQQEKNPGQTYTDTAKLVNKTDHVNSTQRSRVTSDINLGIAIENDYELAMAKTRKDALKIIEQRQKKQVRRELAQNVILSGTTCDLRQGDSFELIDTLPEGSIDVVITDPPYGADMHKKGTWSVDSHDYDDSHQFIERLVAELPDKLYRVMKKDSHGYLFCDWRYFDRISIALGLAGFRVWQRPIIWYKGSIGAFVDAKHGPRYTYEMIIYFMKGDREIDGIYDDVIFVQQTTHHKHAAGKPAKLYQELLKHSGLPGQTALDLFGGGGPLIEAAFAMKMSSIVFELADDAYAMCVERHQETFGSATK